ncbi:MAG TPA: membrane dipeptidase [Reyranella sp.]|nr:membrane dipeptidase [Reyranella sp.]
MPGLPATITSRLAALLLCLGCLSSCGFGADIADMLLNTTGEHPNISAAEQADHDRLLVADLHADTPMWHRGLRDASSWGNVDLNRMRIGNVGLQIFTMPTHVPVSSGGCTKLGNFDPANILAASSLWPVEAWSSPFQRAVQGAKALHQAIDRTARRTTGTRLQLIESFEDFKGWLSQRFPPGGGQNRDIVGVIFGVEGAHAFDPNRPEQFEELYRRGLRLASPTHHYDNAYGHSSEGCQQTNRFLKQPGIDLIEKLMARSMIIDLAHGATDTVRDGVILASARKRPVLISHTGFKSYLENPAQQPKFKARVIPERATTDEELLWVAGTGGTVGNIFWERMIGDVKLDNVVASIVQAHSVLKKAEGTVPEFGFHRIERASQHISIGSDWDGGARNAIDPSGLAALSAALRKHFDGDAVADIMGRNACRVIAQSLSGGDLDFGQAVTICTRP